MRFIYVITLLFLVSSCHKKNNLNVILILTDDQGWGDIGITGNPYLNTPNLDELATKGVFFESFYVNPVCSPTRAEILTGRYHPKSGVYSTSQGGERIDLDETLFPEYFKSNGYSTAIFGKWHNGQQHPYHPTSRGFDEFLGYCSGHLGNYFDAELEHNGRFVNTSGYLTDVLTDNAISFMKKSNKNPFFIFLSMNTPHSPMQVPDQWWKKFENMSINESLSEYDLNHTRAAYAMIENIDWNIGRIISSLKELKLKDNTVVVFLGDNGPNGKRWNDDLKGIKGSTDEGGVKSPLIIYSPNKVAAKKVLQLSGSIDIAPTLLDLAGIPINQTNWDGISLLPYIEGKESKILQRTLYQHWYGNVSVRTNDYRLDKDNILYNIKEDPSQKKPIVSSHLTDSLIKLKNKWIVGVLSQTPNIDLRPIPVIGSKDISTVLPARDAKIFGDNIKRSSKWPNDSFIYQWASNESYIYWPVEVKKEGLYNVSVYYTATEKTVGTQILVKAKDSFVSDYVKNAFDPPLKGIENDRVLRQESYFKEFKELVLPNIFLSKGKYEIKLQKNGLNPGIDFKRLILKKD